MKIANDQGMPIYTINQQNLATTLPQLQVGSQVRSEIINAVNAGKMVTVSQANINSGGWNGCGYIISDTETGAGAYMISGGTSGSMVNLGKDLLWGTFTLLGVLLALSGLGVAALLVAVFTNFLISILDSLINKTDFNFGKTLFSTLLGMGGTTLLGALVSGSLYMSLGAIALTPFGFGIIAAGILLVVLMTVGQMLINIAAREESERGRLV